jgi:hypothetical protein
MVTVLLTVRTMTVMTAILVDISIDNHSWYTPSAVGGIVSNWTPDVHNMLLHSCDKLTMHVTVIEFGHAFILLVAGGA